MNSLIIMTKKSLTEREKKRFNLNNMFRFRRLRLLNKYKNERNSASKSNLHFQIQKLPRNSAPVRMRRRCWKTARPRGYYRHFGTSRHVLREMMHKGFLPGVIKSSW